MNINLTRYTQQFNDYGVVESETGEYVKLSDVTELLKDAERLAFLINNNLTLIECTNQMRGFKSTAPDAVREVWYEHEGWIVSSMSVHTESFQTQRDAIDAAMLVAASQT